MTTAYDFEAQQIDGKTVNLKQFEGKALLVVNTASACGFTPQFGGLEKLHERYGDKGLVVLGFPCNQFGAQDPGSNEDIASFCQRNYGVSFPMFAKVEVNGDDTHPIFKLLKQSARGLLGSEGIKWNFTKFLVNREGAVIERYAPTTAPEAIAKDIEKLL